MNKSGLPIHFLKWAVLFVVCVCLNSCHSIDLKARVKLPSGATILCLGGSITYGLGVNLESSYPYLLHQTLGAVQVINEGVPGLNSTQILARTPRLLAKYKPAVVILELQGDPSQPENPIRESKDLKQIVGLIQKAGAIALLLTTPEAPDSPESVRKDSSIFNQYRASSLVPEARDLVSPILSDPTLRQNENLPNSKGYRLIAERLASMLEVSN